MTCPVKLKPLFLLLLFFYCSLPVFSQDSLFKKEVIVSQLLSIKIQLVSLEKQLEHYEKESKRLNLLIQKSQMDLQNSLTTMSHSNEIIVQLKLDLEKQMELLAISDRESRKLEILYQTLLGQSTKLLKQLKTLETQNNILLGTTIGLGVAAIVEGLILIFR